MKQHALQAALTLYNDGTLELEAAASRAGVTPERLETATARLGVDRPSPSTESERVSLGAD